jgi:hypothetical protein
MPDQILMDIIGEHLPYEIDTLRLACLMLSKFPAPQTWKQEVGKNALVECFALHGRSLMDFFSNKRTDATDAIARDFTTGYVCPFDLKTDQRLKTVRIKLNKQIFHLTKNRKIAVADRFDVGTDGVTLLNHIENAIKEFTKHLKPDFQSFKCTTGPITISVHFTGQSSQPMGVSSQSGQPTP